MDSIILLNPSDIISESMNTINHNFEVISTYEDVTSYKIDQFTKQYKEDLAELKDLYNSKDLEILDNINSLNDRITNIPSLDNLQDAISSAITESAGSLEAFIQQKAGDYVESRLGDYAKTADIDSAGYITSSAFELYKSNAAAKTASVSLIAGNSRFLKDDNGDFIYGATGESATGISSIEDYYNSLDPDSEEKAYIDGESGDSDSDTDKLKNPDVINRLIGKCEEKFKTVATELASFSQTVAEGISASSIINLVEGSDGEDIVSAIFSEANKDGSTITLYADKINLDSNHRLELNTGEFVINSNNFLVNENGRVTATDLVLRTTNGNTTIDSDGILHANGADIRGNIKASQFEATSVDEDLIRTTVINGSSFTIEASGSVTPTGGGNAIPVDGNVLYISIEKELANPEDSSFEGDTLYGVPVLCMRYEGVDYVLSPASWISKAATGDMTNMRWITQYPFLAYNFSGYNNNSYVLNGNLTNTLTPGASGKYYIFKDSTTCISTSGVPDSICRFQVFDLGTDVSENVALIKSSGLAAQSATDMASVNNTGAYTLGSRINNSYIDNTVGTRTKIDSDTCGIFNSYLVNSLSGSIPYSITSYDENGTLTNVMSSIYTKLIEYGCDRRNWTWNNRNFPEDGTHTSIFDPLNTIVGLLPFSNTPVTTSKSFKLTLTYYPQINYTDYGKTVSTTTNTVWVNCSVVVYGTYDQTNQANRIKYVIDDYQGVLPSGQSYEGESYLTSMEFRLQFNLVLNFTGSGISFDPQDEEISKAVLGKVENFLTNYDFNTVTHNRFFTFAGEITDTDDHRYTVNGFED